MSLYRAFAIAVSACLCVIDPSSAGAQTLYGALELAFGAGSDAAAGLSQSTGTMWYGYTLGLATPLVDPRLFKINGDVSLRAGHVSAAGATTQAGSQRDIGYRVSAIVLPAGGFPLTVEASRERVAEQGDYFASNGLRGGIVTPVNPPADGFATNSNRFGLAWRITAPGLPQVDVSYRRSASQVDAGPVSGDQRADDLHLGVTKDTSAVRQSLQFVRTGYESALFQGFTQRVQDLNYDLQARLSSRVRISARTGSRTHDSLFAVAAVGVSDTTGAYVPPSQGASATRYAAGTLTAELSRGCVLDLTGTIDRQMSAAAQTSARIVTASLRVDAVRGLSIAALATHGFRGQVVNGVPLDAVANSGQASAVYRFGLRWLSGATGGTIARGTNTAIDGRAGDTSSRSAQATISATWAGIGLSSGVDLTESRDAIMDFGNLSAARVRASASGRIRRLSFEGSWERARVERGMGATRTPSLQTAVSWTAALPVSAALQFTFNAGQFASQFASGRDSVLFAGAGVEARLRGRVHLTAWTRLGSTLAVQARLDHRTAATMAAIDYRIGALTVAVECRWNVQQWLTTDRADYLRSRGRHVLVRFSRSLGVRF